jgi:NAD+ kinase
MKVILSPNPYRDRGLKAAQSAERVLRNAGAETSICLPFEVDPSFDLPALDYRKMADELPNADMVVSFGGDGTILHASKDVLNYNIPVLGVNLGSVGFMAEVEVSEMSSLSKLPVGKYRLEEHIMLDVRVVRDGNTIFKDVALNDAVITKGAVARMVDLEVYADNHMASSFSGDGLVISTPTGSTAYSMAAGGPIVEPTAANLIITPICAHSLHAKSFVLAPERKIMARMDRHTRRNAYLSVDGGKALRLTSGDEVRVRISEYKTRLVRLTNRTFYELINQKLGQL